MLTYQKTCLPNFSATGHQISLIFDMLIHLGMLMIVFEKNYASAILIYNERSSQAAKQLASVASTMAMREIPHCCQQDDGLKFPSINLWYVRVPLLKRK